MANIPSHRVFAAAVLLLLALPGVGAVIPGGPGRAASAALPAGISTLILVTGDRVQVTALPDGNLYASVRPGEGRERMSFVRTSRTTPQGGKELTIVPADAAPLLAAGLLDASLFDISGLVRQGFGARGPEVLPLIVTFQAAGATGAPLLMASAGLRPVRALPSIDGVAVEESEGSAGRFWKWLAQDSGPGDKAAAARTRAAAVGLTKVWLDGRARPLLDQSGPQVGLPAARQAGLTGRGVTVAVLDTGIKADHPDLAGRVVESRDFTGTRPDAGDDVGHGTHVAGILAGSGAASSGRLEGMAPEANLLNGKVCEIRGCPFSVVIAGMEWAAPQARVVNMSLGGLATDGTDPLSQAVNNLSAAHGSLFVVAAGNLGRAQSVSTPAAADAALAVGSVTKQDAMSPFSSRGPRRGDLAFKPDLVAPGSEIVAARAPGTEVGDAQPVGESYARVSGTSMAAPHAAGVAALLLQAHPDLTGAQLKAALMSTATPIAAGIFDQGAGRLDAARAASQRVFAASGSLDFGFVPWPRGGEPLSRTLAYVNVGPASVTLDLEITLFGGGPAPAGMFTVSPRRLTVPAGGTATAGVTLDPAAVPAQGLFHGRLVASGGSTILRTPLALDAEPESFDLTLESRPRTGTFVFSFANIVNLETGAARSTFDREGSIVLRLPKGTYEINGVVRSDDPLHPEGTDNTLVSEPSVALVADTRVILDASGGRRLSVTVDDPAAVSRGELVSLVSRVGEDQFDIGAFGLFGARLFAVPSARAVAGRTYVFLYEPVLGVPTSADPDGDDPEYTLVFFERGRIPERLDFQARRRELAQVRMNFHAQGVPRTAFRENHAFVEGLGFREPISSFESAVPRQRTAYFTARSIRWRHFVGIDAVGGWLESTGGEARYRPGDRRVLDINQAPLGPAFAAGSGGMFRTPGHIEGIVDVFSSNEKGHTTASSHLPGMVASTTLSRDGVLLGQSAGTCLGSFAVPASPGTYTLSCTATRIMPHTVLGTSANVTWTFQDAGPAEQRPLPLLSVRAKGEVDLLNQAAAGRVHPLHLRVERQPGSASAAITDLDLEVSFDDGATWRQVPVLRLPFSDQGLALYRHPAAAGFVSLRARASDSRGNSVDQTMIRAYQAVPR